MKLTDIKIKNAKPKVKQYKMADGGGLFLLVMPNGSKYWRYKYRHFGKERVLPLEYIPESGLKKLGKNEKKRKIFNQSLKTLQ